MNDDVDEGEDNNGDDDEMDQASEDGENSVEEMDSYAGNEVRILH